jgi:hypothetical protein
MKILIRFAGMMLCLGLMATISFGQAVGDYGSAGTGNWGTVGTWVVCATAGTWTGATAASAVPDSTKNVWILAGTTVTVDASGKLFNNLTVENGATLAAANSLPTSSLRYLRSYGTSITNNGTIGSPTDILGVQLWGLASQTLTITGTGTTNFSRVQPQKSGQAVVFDANVNLNYAGSSGTGSTALYCANGDFSVTINAGKTVTMAKYAFTAVNTSSATSAGNANFTMNIYGSFVTGKYSHINLNNTTGKTSTLTVFNGGSLVLGDSTTLRANVSGPTYTIAINNGASVSAGVGSTYNLSFATTTVDGTLDFGSAITSTRSVGTATVSSTGRLRLMDATYPSGSITLNSGSTVEYYGASGFTMPASPTTYQNLQINNPAGITLGANVTTGGLTLTNGALTTGADTISIASGGSVSRTNGYVIGTLQKYLAAGSGVGVSFELGTANGYSPVSIVFANVTTPGNISGSIVAGDPANLATSGIDASKNVNQYWSFKSDAAFDTYTGTLNFVSGDVDGGANPANFVARAHNGNAWTPLTVGTKTATSTEISGPAYSGGTIALGEPVGTNVTITTSAGTGGSISPSGAVVLSYATTQAFTVTPTSGYHLDTLLVDEVKVDSTTSYTFVNPIADHTIRAVFSHNDFQIVASADVNGSITPSGTIDLSTGANKRFTFAGNSGYAVDSVIVDGVKVDSTASYTFTNVTSNHTIRVTFAPGQYTITATSGANGSITPSGSVPVNFKANQAFSLTPATNYHVDSLFVDGVKVDSTTSYTFVNVSANHTIRAVFAIDQFAISATATTGGTITPSGTVNVIYGMSQAFTFSASVHYQLDSVVVDGVKVDSTSSYTFDNVTAPHTIQVILSPVVMSVRSNGTGGGSWNTVSTWQGGFVPILSDTVTILATDTVTVGGNMSCKTINVFAGGRIVLLSSDTLAVTSPDSLSTINGTIVNAGLIAVSGKLQFGSGATYQHARNGGSIPTSRWGTGSTCLITGLTGNAPSNGNQNFYSIKWNCPGQTSNLNLGWNGNTIGGNIEIDSSGTSRWQLCAPSSGTDSAHLSVATVTINGNIIQTGGQLSSNGTSNGFTAITINAMGNITVTGGNFSVSRGSQGGTGTTTWNVYGDFSLSNATTQNSNPAGAKFVFAKSGVQSLKLGVGNTLSALPIEVKSGGTLNIDTCVLAGSGIFKLDSAATLVTARTDGLNGNLTNTGTITLSPYANFVFDGIAAQLTGAMLPSHIQSLTVNNAAGVVLSDTVTVADSLYLTAGKLRLAGNVLTAKGIVGSSSTKYVVTDSVGSLSFASVGSAEVLFPVGTTTAYAPLWITNSGTADAFSVAVVPDAGTAPLGGRVNAKWRIAEGTAGGSNCTLKFGWMASLEDATFAADRAGNAAIFRLGTDTAAIGTGAYTSQFTSEPYTLSRAGITSFGSLAVGKFSTITSVNSEDLVPRVFSLSQNYPNPFNPSTTIMYGLPQQSRVTVKLYSILGQEVRTLVDETQNASFHRVQWNGRDNYGMQVSTGVYFFRINAVPLDGKTHAFTQVKKMLLMK